MATLTVAQKIAIADISEYLATVAIEKGGLWAKGIDIELPSKIRNIKDSIEYRYNSDPSDTTLTSTSNYLYALCGKFALQAQAVLPAPGTISGIIAPTTPSPYQFTVDASTSFIIDGQSSKTITAFIGYNLLFTRGNLTQNTMNDGISSYYSWVKATGSFVMYPAAATGEVIGLFPI
jgi:hypothetical protein